MPQSLSDVNIHFVFGTKNRSPWLSESLSSRLHGYLGGIIRERECVLVHAGGMPDHLHLLIRMARVITMADLIRDIKAGSSKWIHESGSGMSDFQWQAGYGAFSVSRSQMPMVASYIQNQAKHHRTRGFQEEYRSLLKKHGIEWDERYVWD